MVVLLYFIFFKSFAASFDCSKIDAKTGFSWDNADGCLRNVLFQPKIHEDTLSTVREYYKNYVYKDIVVDSGEPFNLKVDISTELESIETQTYETDYDFHADLQRVFNKLKDPHTQYVPPLCYTLFQIQLPFISICELVNGTQRLFVAPSDDLDLPVKYTAVYPSFFSQPTTYTGWEILEINGEPAFDYLLEYSQTTTSYSRDASVRFNYALSEFFDYTTMTHAFPSESGVEFKLRHPTTLSEETITAKYLVSGLLDVNEISRGTGFYRLCGYEITGRRAVKVEDSDHHHPWEDVLLSEDSNTVELVKYLKNKKRVRKDVSSRRHLAGTEDSFNNVVHSDYLAAYVHSSKPIGVMILPSFYMANVESYLHDVTSVLKFFKTMEITKLIIDVRRNGGGYLCLPYFIASLVSKYYPLAPNSVGDIIMSQYWKKYFCRGDMVRFEFLDLYRKPISTLDWISSPSSHDRGTTTSRPFSNDCNIFRYTKAKMSTPDASSPTFYEPENIVILTDGTCGSACGIFISSMRSLGLAKVVVQGGIVGAPISLSSFKGASVYDSLFINNQNEVCKRFCECERIPPFPATSLMRFSWFEIYSSNALSANDLTKTDFSSLLGFSRLEYDLRILDWDFSLSHSGVIFDIASLAFDMCFPWEIKLEPDKNVCSASIPRGSYGFPCENGTFKSDGSCQIRGCSRGYYLSEDKGQCLSMPREYPMFSDYEKYLWRAMFNETILPTMIAVILICFCCCGCCWGAIAISLYIRRKRRRDNVNGQNGADNQHPYQHPWGIGQRLGGEGGRE